MTSLNLAMGLQFLYQKQFYGGDGVQIRISADVHLCDQNYDFHALSHDAAHFPLCLEMLGWRMRYFYCSEVLNYFQIAVQKTCLHVLLVKQHGPQLQLSEINVCMLHLFLKIYVYSPFSGCLFRV